MHVCHVLPKEDQTLPFVAINMMDRYFRHTPKANSETPQVQLTGLTGLFMVSKYFEIQPIFLDQLVNEMAYKKYNAKQFLDKETELMSLLACDIDPPNHFDFTLLYFKYIKMQIHGVKGAVSRSCLTFIEQYEALATDFCRMVLTDIEMVAMRPSILGAAAIHFGLESA